MNMLPKIAGRNNLLSHILYASKLKRNLHHSGATFWPPSMILPTTSTTTMGTWSQTHANLMGCCDALLTQDTIRAQSEGTAILEPQRFLQKTHAHREIGVRLISHLRTPSRLHIFYTHMFLFTLMRYISLHLVHTYLCYSG
jgi:hypothetical protein